MPFVRVYTSGVQAHMVVMPRSEGNLHVESPAPCLAEIQRMPGVPFSVAVDWLGDWVVLEKVGEGD